MSGQRTVIVDVFAEAKYQGNQLAVVLDPHRSLSEEEMLQIARETNFSETTFVAEESDGAWGVRIFTPVEELPFAGHPTLGTAWVIQNDLLSEPRDTVSLDLAVGRIPVTFESPLEPGALLWMRQQPPQFGGTLTREILAPVLSLQPDDLDDRFPSQVVSTGTPMLIVPIRRRHSLERARLQTDLYYQLNEWFPAKSIYLFCPEPEDPTNQLKARLFAEALGVPEDPATGSACGCLGGWLVQHDFLGKPQVKARLEQGAEIGRPSLLRLRASRTDDTILVEVGGRVIPTFEGRLI